MHTCTMYIVQCSCIDYYAEIGYSARSRAPCTIFIELHAVSGRSEVECIIQENRCYSETWVKEGNHALFNVLNKVRLHVI
jgi:hypothetical protein